MKTQSQPRIRTDARAGTVSAASTRAGRDGGGPTGGIAVVVERADRTCALFFRGASECWPSVDEAKNAVAQTSTHLVWRETTPGVWVARADVSDATSSDRGSRRSPKIEPPREMPRTGTATYMAARVLRGVVLSGDSDCVEPASTTGSAA